MNSIHQLVSSNDLEGIRKLGELLDQNQLAIALSQKDQAGFTAFLLAAALGYTEIMRELLRYNADTQQTTPSGNSALMMAAKNNHSGAVLFLLKEANADANFKNKNHDTALMFACAGGVSVEICKYLITIGNANLSDVNLNKHSVFHLMTTADIAEFLLRECIRQNKVELLHRPDAQGNTPLHWLIKKLAVDCVEVYLRLTPPAEKRIVFASVNNSGQTPLMLAKSLEPSESRDRILDMIKSELNKLEQEAAQVASDLLNDKKSPKNNKRKKKKIKSTQTLAEDKKESTTTEKSVQDSPSMINEDRTAKLVDAPTTQREHVTHDSSVNGTVIIPETAGTNEIRDITQVVTEENTNDSRANIDEAFYLVCPRAKDLELYPDCIAKALIGDLSEFSGEQLSAIEAIFQHGLRMVIQAKVELLASQERIKYEETKALQEEIRLDKFKKH